MVFIYLFINLFLIYYNLFETILLYLNDYIYVIYGTIYEMY